MRRADVGGDRRRARASGTEKMVRTSGRGILRGAAAAERDGEMSALARRLIRRQIARSVQEDAAVSGVAGLGLFQISGFY